jgi:hypothetical protein
MRMGRLVNATIGKGRCRYEMFCIPTTQWQCACADFAKQRNGSGGREKDP